MHLAARVHVLKEYNKDLITIYRRVNTTGTDILAQNASRAGIRRFIYISTIKVNGENTDGCSFKADDVPAPIEPDGISKYEAEIKLHEISKNTDMEIVIIRPPLIYGPGVGANYFRLMEFIDRGIPLPFKCIRNSRSMVSIANVIDLITQCLDNPAAAGETFLVSDGVAWSTPLLIEKIASFMGVKPHLYPLPVSILRFIGLISGNTATINRLCNSLEVDISKTCGLLNWKPPQLPEDGINQTVKWYLEKKRF